MSKEKDELIKVQREYIKWLETFYFSATGRIRVSEEMIAERLDKATKIGRLESHLSQQHQEPSEKKEQDKREYLNSQAREYVSNL